MRKTTTEQVGINPTTKTAHTLLVQRFEDNVERVYVREVCNVDDIGQGGIQRVEIEPTNFTLSEDYSWCGHCGPRG